MKNLFEPTSVREVKERIALLRSDSERLWGKMSPSQTLAHCAMAMEWAVGDRIPEGMFFARILGRIVKPMVFRDDAPLRRNSPTAKDLIVQDARDLEKERDRLCALIDRFASSGPRGCTKNSHSFFGPLTPDEWAVLTYKHLDHHLRQFGV